MCQTIQETVRVDDIGRLRFGCVVFDDPGSHTTGWKAVEESPATRVNIEGTGSLSTDIIWLTNLGYQISKTSGLDGNYRFLTSDYLRENICKMAERHGIACSLDNSDPRALAEFGAQILSRVMCLSKRILEVDPEDDFLPRFTLKQGFRDIAGIGRDPVYPTEMSKRIEEAISYNTNCEREQYVPAAEDVIAYLRIPPREHCLAVMDVALPYGEFVEIPKGDLPSAKASIEETQNWLIHSIGDLPGFFKITCRSFDPLFNNLINFGDSANGMGMSSYKRQWVSSPEVAFLATFSEMTIHQAFITKSRYRLNQQLELIRNMPAQTDMSVSMGVFYENMWTGMCARSSGRLAQNSPDKVSINAFTPYIRAMDRVKLFEKAIKFSQAGLDVAGYATGMLRVSIKGQDPVKIYNLCSETRMIPPFLGCDARSLPAPDHNDPLSFTQWMYATSNYKMLMDVDKKLVDRIVQR